MDTAPHDDDVWFDYHLIVRGSQITIKINGKTVVDYTEPPSRSECEKAPPPPTFERDFRNSVPRPRQRGPFQKYQGQAAVVGAGLIETENRGRISGMAVKENPFPGMNPFMERRWSNMHLMMLSYMNEALAAELPDDLYIGAEESISVESDSQTPPGQIIPDVAVKESWKEGIPPTWQPESDEGGIAVAKPEIVYSEPETERWLEIRDLDENLVTAIELLSPANKNNPSREVLPQKAGAISRLPRQFGRNRPPQNWLAHGCRARRSVAGKRRHTISRLRFTCHAAVRT